MQVIAEHKTFFITPPVSITDKGEITTLIDTEHIVVPYSDHLVNVRFDKSSWIMNGSIQFWKIHLYRYIVNTDRAILFASWMVQKEFNGIVTIKEDWIDHTIMNNQLLKNMWNTQRLEQIPRLMMGIYSR